MGAEGGEAVQPILKKHRYDQDFRVRNEAERWLRTFEAMVVDLEPKLEEYTRRLIQADVVLCLDPGDEAWFFRHAATCEDPVEPWELGV